MTDVATIIADLVKAGVDPDLVGRTAAALASREPVVVADEQASRRREKDRERKRNLRKSADVGGVCGPPINVPPHPPITTPHSSEADASDADASSAKPSISAAPVFETPTDRVWGEGLPDLISLGAPERQARSMIGKWLRDTHDPAGVLSAIQAARDAGSGDPIPFVTRVLNPTISRNGQGHGRQDTAVAALDRQIARFDGPSGFGGNVFGERPALLTAHVRGRG